MMVMLTKKVSREAFTQAVAALLAKYGTPEKALAEDPVLKHETWELFKGPKAPPQCPLPQAFIDHFKIDAGGLFQFEDVWLQAYAYSTPVGGQPLEFVLLFYHDGKDLCAFLPGEGNAYMHATGELYGRARTHEDVADISTRILLDDLRTDNPDPDYAAAAEQCSLVPLGRITCNPKRIAEGMQGNFKLVTGNSLDPLPEAEREKIRAALDRPALNTKLKEGILTTCDEGDWCLELGAMELAEKYYSAAADEICPARGGQKPTAEERLKAVRKHVREAVGSEFPYSIYVVPALVVLYKQGAVDKDDEASMGTFEDRIWERSKENFRKAPYAMRMMSLTEAARDMADTAKSYYELMEIHSKLELQRMDSEAEARAAAAKAAGPVTLVTVPAGTDTITDNIADIPEALQASGEAFGK